MSKKYVYLFKEGNADMRELLGGKGANLAEMTMLLGTASAFGDATSVQAASIKGDMSYCEITQEVSEDVQDSARGIFSVYYEVIVDNTAIKEKAKSSSKTIRIARKGAKYKKVGESGDWIKISCADNYGYIIKSALKKV